MFLLCCNAVYPKMIFITIVPMNNEVFPVINSTLSPNYLAVWVSAQYGFKNVECQLLKTNINHTYRISTDSADYILRVYNPNHRSIHDVAEEVKLLCEVKNIVSISFPVANAKKEYIQEINAPEGNRYVVFFSFAEGKKIRQLTTALNFNIGVEVGSFHHFTGNKSIERVNYSVDILINWAYRHLARYFSEEMEEMRFIKALEAILPDAFGKQHPTKGIVHLDIWYDNMSIRDNGIITLFDFDNCGNGWLILDIGYYCMHLFYIEPDKEEYERKKDAFISGYRSKNQLPDNELELIPYAGLAIWIHYLGVAAKNFDNIANFYLSENYVKIMIARVKDWLKYHNIEVPHS